MAPQQWCAALLLWASPSVVAGSDLLTIANDLERQIETITGHPTQAHAAPLALPQQVGMERADSGGIKFTSVAEEKALKTPYDPFDPALWPQVKELMAADGHIVSDVHKGSIKSCGTPTQNLHEVLTLADDEHVPNRVGHSFLLSTVMKDPPNGGGVGLQKAYYNLHVNYVKSRKIYINAESKLHWVPVDLGADGKPMKIADGLSTKFKDAVSDDFLEMFQQALPNICRDHQELCPKDGQTDLEYYVFFTREITWGGGLKVYNVTPPTVGSGVWNFNLWEGKTSFNSDDFESVDKNGTKYGSTVFFAGGDVFSYMSLNQMAWKPNAHYDAFSIFAEPLLRKWREGTVLLSGQSAGTIILGAHAKELFWGMSGDPQPANPSYSRFKDAKSLRRLDVIEKSKTPRECTPGGDIAPDDCTTARVQDGNACTGKLDNIKDTPLVADAKPDQYCQLQDCDKDLCITGTENVASAAITCKEHSAARIGGFNKHPGCDIANTCRPVSYEGENCGLKECTTSSCPPDWKFRIKIGEPYENVTNWENVISSHYETMGLLPFAIRPHTTAIWACDPQYWGTGLGDYNTKHGYDLAFGAAFHLTAPKAPQHCMKTVHSSNMKAVGGAYKKQFATDDKWPPLLAMTDTQAVITIPCNRGTSNCKGGFRWRIVDKEELCFDPVYANLQPGDKAPGGLDGEPSFYKCDGIKVNPATAPPAEPAGAKKDEEPPKKDAAPAPAPAPDAAADKVADAAEKPAVDAAPANAAPADKKKEAAEDELPDPRDPAPSTTVPNMEVTTTAADTTTAVMFTQKAAKMTAPNDDEDNEQQQDAWEQVQDVKPQKAKAATKRVTAKKETAKKEKVKAVVEKAIQATTEVTEKAKGDNKQEKQDGLEKAIQATKEVTEKAKDDNKQEKQDSTAEATDVVEGTKDMVQTQAKVQNVVNPLPPPPSERPKGVAPYLELP